MSPPTTHTLRLTMKGSAGLKVVISVADAGSPGMDRSGCSSRPNMKRLKIAATTTPTTAATMQTNRRRRSSSRCSNSVRRSSAPIAMGQAPTLEAPGPPPASSGGADVDGASGVWPAGAGVSVGPG